MIFTTNNNTAAIAAGIMGGLILATLFTIIPFPVHAQTSAQCGGGDQRIDSLESDGDDTRYDDFYYLVDNGYLSFSQFSKQNGTVKITITNNTECNYPLSLSAYSMVDNTLGTQKLHDQDYKIIPANTSRGFNVSFSQCLTEIDVFSGQAPQERFNDNRNANRLIGYTFVGNSKDVFAENDIFNGGRHDEFPQDDDDGYQNATGNFCSQTCGAKLIDSLGDDNDESRLDDFYYLIDNNKLSFSDFTVNEQSSASITITNNTNCTYPMSLNAYKMFDNQLSSQELFDNQYKNVQPKSNATFQVDLPQCMAQIDLFSDPVPTQRHNGSRNTNRLIGYTFQLNTRDIAKENDILDGGQHDSFPNDDDDGYQNATGNFCATDEPKDLTGSCSVSPQNPLVGQTVTWEAEASGGSGSISYSWSGDVTTDSKTVSKEYNSAGTKQATVTIESGDQSIQRTCRVTVQQQSQPQLRGSCRVTPDDVKIQEDVSWIADIRGGNPPYEYDWNLEGSSDEVNDDRIQTEYDRDGTFDGDLQVTDEDGNTIFRSCGNVRVRSDDEEDELLEGSCQVSPDETSVGEAVTWEVDISSGNPPYEYDWDLESSSDEDDQQSISTGYDNTGTFEGGVRVTDSDGDSLSKSCGRVKIQEDEADNNDFSVSCRPDQSSYLVGEKVTFRASIQGDVNKEDIDFNWKHDNGYNFNEQNDQVAVQYVESGAKQVVVRANYNGRTRSDVCSVDIRSAGSTKGVQLDDIPYTGPQDTAKTLGFLGGISFISLAGGLLIIRRRYSDSIPVGIPDDFS